MFELPECLTLAKQINQVMRRKIVARRMLGNSPHKFVWYNRTHSEFERLTRGKRVGKSVARGRWLFIPLQPGYVLLIGECGGKMLHHSSGAPMPKKYHLCLTFEDGSFFTVTTQMWGAMELHDEGKERESKYVKNMKPTPVDAGFTFEHFDVLIDGLEDSRSVKGLLTQDQLIPGLGNSIAQDILFKAGLHPRAGARRLSAAQRKKLYRCILDVTRAIADKGGRDDELDLHGRPGGYRRIMDKDSAGNPCPRCGTTIQKMQYLGGACYFCPSCQKLDR
jgi:formamidopyrimidine-DNA glycosylase